MYYATIKIRFDTTNKLSTKEALEVLNNIKATSKRHVYIKIVKTELNNWSPENRSYL